MFKLTIICGGPSLERGISLNSARSLMDHLHGENITVDPIYVDTQKNFYKLSRAQLYSNTPHDFDFKLKQKAQKLLPFELINTLKSADLVFPIIHGAFGEDGELQTLLEEADIPFVGPSSLICKNMFDKYIASNILKSHNFNTIPSLFLVKPSIDEIQNFFATHSLTKAVVKPTAGGSSIGVSLVTSPEAALEKASLLGEPALLEPFCRGKEFTVVILQNPDGSPVALIPTEIEISYENNQIFDYRRKYLPTSNTFYHTPPRFSFEITQKIQSQAEKIFYLFGMHDFARIDGWLLDTGEIIFSDLNPISGMEQNSFLFRQGALCGMSHKQILLNILHTTCKRYNILPPSSTQISNNKNRKPVFVLFGNNNSERQVSLMSGTNVWHKLRHSSQYSPLPFLLDQKNCVWSLPHAFTLNHTVEEIYTNCLNAPSLQKNLDPFLNHFLSKFHHPTDLDLTETLPQHYTFHDFLQLVKTTNAFLFIALHGAEGENGTLQKVIEDNNISYNGSNPKASALCMDKFQTGKIIQSLHNPSILALPKRSISLFDLLQENHIHTFWYNLVIQLGSSSIIVKPCSDGCSTGIVTLFSAKDLQTYIHFFRQNASLIPPNTFKNQSEIVELSIGFKQNFIFEPYITTDKISIEKNSLIYQRKTGWIELTVGILETQGRYHSLNPSITIASGNILSLEEKFQGGTGINLTPPPSDILSSEMVNQIKRTIEITAAALKISNYARIDIFFNTKTLQIIIIEANSLPALTPSTVLYHQALEESPPIYPQTFLETIITNKIESYALQN